MELCGTELTLPFTSQLAWRQQSVVEKKKSCIGSTPLCSDWIPKKKQHRRVKVCSVHSSRHTVYQGGGGGMPAAQGASSWSHCSCSQDTGGPNASAPLSFSFASTTVTSTAWDDVSTFKVALLPRLIPSWKHPQRHTQRGISLVILSLISLTVKMNNLKCHTTFS